MTAYVAQWYMKLYNVGPEHPRYLYGVLPFEADDQDDADRKWENFLDADLFDHPVYQLVPNVGAVEYDLTELPDDWNFEEVVCVDLAEAWVAPPGWVGGDTPGTFYCNQQDGWTAHYSREDRAYCIHPADESEPAFLIESWDDPKADHSRHEPAQS